MSYVFDNSPLSVLFKNFYRRTFRSLWERFDELVATGHIVSTREALREIEDGAADELLEWARRNSKLFAMPTAAEGAFVAQIYAVRHFQQNIEQQKLLRGGKNADPFVIARAAVEGRAVVTMEQFKRNAAKIPNICEHFKIRCLTHPRAVYGRARVGILAAFPFMAAVTITQRGPNTLQEMERLIAAAPSRFRSSAFRTFPALRRRTSRATTACR